MDPRIKKYMERLGLIYYGLIAPPLLLFPVVYLPLKDGALKTSSQQFFWENASYYVAGLLLFLLMFFARRLFKRNLRVITGNWSFEQKLKGYQRASVQFYVFGFISCLSSVFLLFISEHQLFVATYPILLLLVSIYWPTIQRLKRELPLSEKELTMIKNEGQKTKNIG